MSEVLEQLIIELRADTANVTAGLATVQKQLGAVDQAVTKSGQRVSGALSVMEGAARRVTGTFAAAFSVNAFVDAGREMQNLQKRLLSATGSMENAATSMSLLRQMAADQHVDLMQLSDGYVRLLPLVKQGALSFDEMTKLLRLTNDNVRAFGMSAGDVDGIMIGLSQALGSGRASMEDIRQVTDRIPGSMAAMAKAMGTNVAGLYEMAQKGTLTAESIKGGLIAALAEAEGAAENMGGTFDSASADMTNAFRDFADTVAQSGLFEFIIAGIDDVANAFQVAEAMFLRFKMAWQDFGDFQKANIEKAMVNVNAPIKGGRTAAWINKTMGWETPIEGLPAKKQSTVSLVKRV